MRRKFLMVGKGKTKIRIGVEVDTQKSAKREDLLRLNSQLKNAAHKTLREFGYNVEDIRLSKMPFKI